MQLNFGLLDVALKEWADCSTRTPRHERREESNGRILGADMAIASGDTVQGEAHHSELVALATLPSSADRPH